MTTIRTAKERTILLQHDVMSPRPYSRLNLIAEARRRDALSAVQLALWIVLSDGGLRQGAQFPGGRTIYVRVCTPLPRQST